MQKHCGRFQQCLDLNQGGGPDCCTDMRLCQKGERTIWLSCAQSWFGRAMIFRPCGALCSKPTRSLMVFRNPNWKACEPYWRYGSSRVNDLCLMATLKNSASNNGVMRHTARNSRHRFWKVWRAARALHDRLRGCAGGFTYKLTWEEIVRLYRLTLDQPPTQLAAPV